MATLHATAHKQRIVHIFLHSISTVLTAFGVFEAGNDDGVDADIELFKTFAMALYVRLLHFVEIVGYAAGNMSTFAFVPINYAAKSKRKCDY